MAKDHSDVKRQGLINNIRQLQNGQPAGLDLGYVSQSKVSLEASSTITAITGLAGKGGSDSSFAISKEDTQHDDAIAECVILQQYCCSLS